MAVELESGIILCILDAINANGSKGREYIRKKKENKYFMYN